MEYRVQIRVVISICLVCFALMIGYELFFRGNAGVTIIMTDLNASETETSALQETDGSSALSAAAAEKVNLNTATAEELQTLYRIGPVLAARIIAYREEQGGFSSIEELQNVSGIGEKIFAEIQDQIEVD